MTSKLKMSLDIDRHDRMSGKLIINGWTPADLSEFMQGWNAALSYQKNKACKKPQYSISKSLLKSLDGTQVVGDEMIVLMEKEGK